MSGKTQSLEFSRTIQVEPAAVYRAFTNATALREWLCDVAEADARQGGRLYLWWNMGYYSAAQYAEIEKDKSVTFGWHGQGEPHATQVKVALEAQDGGTRVTLTHSGIGPGEEWSSLIEGFKRDWNAGLENLQSMLETGMDGRIYRRPMFGIAGANQVDADLAKKLNLPVEEGLQLDVLIKGLSADRAGIQKGDVIVQLGEHAVKDTQTFIDALGAHKAGDKIDVKFYRDAEPRVIKMELMGRPKPDVPASAAALAARLKKAFAESDTQLDDVLHGISDEVAARQPAEGEYSVKDVLAHLIAVQEDFHAWMASLAEGQELNSFTSGFRPRLQAIVATTHTTSDLLHELKHAEARTVEIAAQLPDEFVARKSSYVRMGEGLLQNEQFHTANHINQVRAAIASVTEMVAV